MPRAVVRFHPAAAEEAQAAFEWYHERSVEAAAAFRDDLAHAVEMVAEAPQRWPRLRGMVRRYLFPRFPFTIVYRLRAETVEIVAVAHEKRKPGYWKARRTR
jgi:plasmid stabilization system protein ParE